ncbi:hypothetical protein [Paenibacillus sp. PL91]|uniref:hypothetical protein n=1 Tax=Paenibacillus sp. PL91 TaxID=2729538 RepID=UPI00145E472E|nr:hypothetical protein [Paenibacillus sp. PL91]MBC9205183.1 hypothetical protein [Paenibacillus sp. PL91]
MKKILMAVILLFVLFAGFLTFRFGSALSQEGNPFPILSSISKLEFTNSSYEQYSKTDKSTRFVSKNTGESRYVVVKDIMKKYGWDFKEQLGAGLVFEKNGQTKVVETRQYSRHYILSNIPNDVLS